MDKQILSCLPVCVVSIGGESLAVAQNTYAVKWFQGRELNMVFGLQLSFSRVVRIRSPDEEGYLKVVLQYFIYFLMNLYGVTTSKSGHTTVSSIGHIIDF